MLLHLKWLLFLVYVTFARRLHINISTYSVNLLQISFHRGATIFSAAYSVNYPVNHFLLFFIISEMLIFCQ